MYWILYILAVPAFFFLYYFGKGVITGIKLGLPVVFRIVKNDNIGNCTQKDSDPSEAPTFKIIDK